MLAALPLLLAPALQQDLFVQPAGPSPKPGKVTQVTQYGDRFATGWILDAQGQKQAVRYSEGISLELGAFMPGGKSAGQVVGLFLDLQQATVVATGQTDSLGHLAQTIQVPPQAADATILFQAVVPDHSMTTSVVTVTFE